MSVSFSKEMMSDLLTKSFEGGSNYWISYIEYVPPSGMSIKDLWAAAWEAVPRDKKDLCKQSKRWLLYDFLAYLPASVKWKIEIKNTEDSKYDATLTPDNMRKAASRLLDLDPSTFGRIKEENYDANDADVWLQAALFNEIVFG